MVAPVASGLPSHNVPTEYAQTFMRNPSVTNFFLRLFAGYPLFYQRPALFIFTKEQHVGFEVSAWYWHFVDVVWLFLFISVYW